jgi:hypothetical protein
VFSTVPTRSTPTPSICRKPYTSKAWRRGDRQQRGTLCRHGRLSRCAGALMSKPEQPCLRALGGSGQRPRSSRSSINSVAMILTGLSLTPSHARRAGRARRQRPRKVLRSQRRTGSSASNSRAKALSCRAHLSSIELRKRAQTSA